MKRKETKDNLITTNRKAHHDYTVIDTVEAGISLLGSEVKSCVAKEVSISEAYCVIRGGQVVMLKSTIAPYLNSTYMNHEKDRERVLLLHKRQIRKLKAEVDKSGMTLIPLDMHLSDNGKIKITVGLCKGRNAVDKRQAMKKDEAKSVIREAKRR